jgi:hypothetical protein
METLAAEACLYLSTRNELRARIPKKIPPDGVKEQLKGNLEADAEAVRSTARGTMTTRGVAIPRSTDLNDSRRIVQQ